VFPEFLTNGHFVFSSWFMVVCIGLVFFLVQIALGVRFYFRMRRQQRILNRLSRNFEQRGDGRPDPHAVPASFAWLRWVVANFPAGAKHPPGNFTREDVLQELDTRIASNGDYLLLQRMGIMAPLLGVVLTVVGFYWLHVSEEEQSLQTILLAVTPLIAGVGTGAVLALINQILLHVVGRRAEALRMSARTWFDAVIWSRIGLDTQAATVKVVRAMERIAGSIDEAAQRYADNSAQISQSTTSMNEAASQFRGVVQSFGTEMKGIPEALGDVRRSTAASANALEELIKVGSRAVANLDVSVAAFRTTLDREFTTAAKLHHHSSHTLAESVEQISQAAERLKEGSDEVKLTVQAQQNSHVETLTRSMQRMREMAESMSQATTTLKSMLDQVSQLASRAGTTHEALAKAANDVAGAGKLLRQTIERDMTPSQRAMHEVAASFAGSAAKLSDFMDEGIGPATEKLITLHETLAGLEDTVDAIRDFSHSRAGIDRLNEALARAAEVNDAISALPEKVGAVLQQQAAPHEAATNSDGGFRTWLSRKPR
jgi:uncharacterized protein YukE